MDAPPAASDALSADESVPGWATRYGTQAGADLLEPSLPPATLAADGPQFPLGFWRYFFPPGSAGITAFAAAPDGRLFIGRQGAGLTVLEPGANGLYTFTTLTTANSGLASNNVTALGISGNWLFIGTSDAGITETDLQFSDWWYNQVGPFSTIPSNKVTNILPMDPGTGYSEFYVGTDKGAWWYRYDQQGVHTNPYLVGHTVTGIDLKWVGSLISGRWVEWVNTYGGVYRWDVSWTNYASVNSCPFDGGYDVAMESDGSAWVGAVDITAASPENETEPAPPAITGPARPGANVVSPNPPPMAQDPEGYQPSQQQTAGAGSDAPNDNYIGLCRYKNGAWTYYGPNSVPTPMPSTVVNDLHSDSAGRIWIGFDFGVAVYDQGTWDIFRSGQVPMTIQGNRVKAITTAGDTAWFGFSDSSNLNNYTWAWNRWLGNQMGGTANNASTVLVESDKVTIGLGTGISQNDGSGWVYTPIPGNNSPITRIVRRGSAYWIATSGSGVYEWKNGVFTQYTDSDGLATADVRDLAVDSQGRLWVAALGGLSVRASDYFLTFNPSNSGLVGDLSSLAVDNAGRVWVGSHGSGLFILDPNAAEGALGAAPEGTPWTQLTMSNGLPGYDVTAVTVEPTGRVWVGTTTGLAYQDTPGGPWTLNGSDSITSLATDSSGRVWAGTQTGLLRFSGGRWERFTAINSNLPWNIIQAVASDGERVYAVTAGILVTHGDVVGPIGFAPPTISNISPASAGAGAVVSITGTNFDGRDPLFNKVSFGDRFWSATQAQVLSASSTSLTVRVPLMAQDGPITVEAHQQIAVSAQSFTLLSKIDSVSPTCAALGSQLTIRGSGFQNQAIYVKIGNGPWRPADSDDPTTVRQFIRPGDTDGVVQVRLGTNGPVVSSTQSVTIDTPVIDQVAIQQGIEGMPMIWGKKTLVMLGLRSQRGLCTSRVSSGQAEFHLKNGTVIPDHFAFTSGGVGTNIGSIASPLRVRSAVNFVLWGSAYSLPVFQPVDLNFVRLSIKNGPVQLMTYDIPAASFNFWKAGSDRRILNVQVRPQSDTSQTRWAKYMKNARLELPDVARVYPQQDVAPYGPNGWMEWSWFDIPWPYPGSIDIKDPGTSSALRQILKDHLTYINDHGGNYDQIMGVVDQALFAPGAPRGVSWTHCEWVFAWQDCESSVAMSFNLKDDLAATYLQEAVHAWGLVKPGMANYDYGNPEEGHSKYDEDERSDICVTSLTYRRSLQDQTGTLRRIVRIGGYQPEQFALIGCDPNLMPKSVMAYVPNGNRENSFLEVHDYRYLFNLFIWGFASNRPGRTEAGQELRIAGEIDASHQVNISLSYLAPAGGVLDPDDSDGMYSLRLKSANGTILEQVRFGQHEIHTHGSGPDTEHFSVRVAFPAGTSLVELKHAGQVIWSDTVSANPPAVTFSSPQAAGVYQPATPIPVAWSASDPNGDPLQFALEFSSDAGATWTPVIAGLTGNSYDLSAGYAPAGSQSRLRITASDGFNTTQAVSPLFTLAPRPPIALISQPEDGLTINEGAMLTLAGDVQTNGNPATVQYDWYLDNALVGSCTGCGGQATTDYFTGGTGAHTVKLVVTDNGLSAEDSVTFHVEPDFDGDGLSNAFEQANGTNPLDATDAANDPEADGLSNLDEQQIGTHPYQPDSDADGVYDGDEVAAGTDPSDGTQLPPATPVLQVGPDGLGYAYEIGGTLPPAHTFWVSNGGPGALSFTAQSNAAWLQVAPSGTQPTPSELTVTVNPAGLAAGQYTAQITISAPGAAGSPKVIPVTLEVVQPVGVQIYTTFLPLVRR
jgi:ligand-binding sensor domain-containing protein